MKKQSQNKRRLVYCRIRDEETQCTKKGIVFDGKSHEGGNKRWKCFGE